MKRTEIERKERELRKFQKKVDNLQKDGKKSEKSVNDYIDDLSSCFLYDENSIFNIKDDIKILEVFEEMKEEIAEKQWENILKKSIRKTGIKNKSEALNELKELLNT